MDPMFWFNVAMRWLHVTAAVVGVGGTIMMRFVLLPVLDRLPNGAEVLGTIRQPFKKLIHSAIGLLLLTGFYNYMVVSIPAVRAAREAGRTAMEGYHPVMGMKILLSFVLFGIAIALLKPVPAVHEQRGKWLSINSLLGLVILLLTAYLRRLWS